MVGRVQLTSDGLKSCIEPIENALEDQVDYAMLVKQYGMTPESEKRYSPCLCLGAKKHAVIGNPEEKHASTNYIERQELHNADEHASLCPANQRFQKKDWKPRSDNRPAFYV